MYKQNSSMTFAELPLDKKIVLFDGVCNLCNASVQFILKRDQHDIYRFVTLQSDLGNAIIDHLNLNDLTIDSIVLYEPHKAFYIKSEAALRILAGLGGLYKLAHILMLLPKGMRNAIYDYIAQHRYRWYGKRATCMLPTPELLRKFLS
jgi:predicted DCC family thiol-disulfide oxidoreductase YuxK